MRGNGNHGTIFGAEATADRLGNPTSALHFSVSSGAGWGAAQDRVVIPTRQYRTIIHSRCLHGLSSSQSLARLAIDRTQ